MTPTIRQFTYTAILLCWTTISNAVASSPLFVHGYTVIPEPQRVQLSGNDFQFGDGWRLAPPSGAEGNLATVDVLTNDLASRYGIRLETQSGKASKTVRLMVRPGSVQIGSATDRDKEKLAEEAYKLE